MENMNFNTINSLHSDNRRSTYIFYANRHLIIINIIIIASPRCTYQLGRNVQRNASFCIRGNKATFPDFPAHTTSATEGQSLFHPTFGDTPMDSVTILALKLNKVWALSQQIHFFVLKLYVFNDAQFISDTEKNISFVHMHCHS